MVHKHINLKDCMAATLKDWTMGTRLALYILPMIIGLKASISAQLRHTFTAVKRSSFQSAPSDSGAGVIAARVVGRDEGQNTKGFVVRSNIRSTKATKVSTRKVAGKGKSRCELSACGRQRGAHHRRSRRGRRANPASFSRNASAPCHTMRSAPDPPGRWDPACVTSPSTGSDQIWKPSPLNKKVRGRDVVIQHWDQNPRVTKMKCTRDPSPIGSLNKNKSQFC